LNIFSSLTPGRGRIPLAVVAGLLWAAAFPRLGVAGFAWLAPGLMLLAGLGTRGKESFRLGYLAGLTHYLVSLHWLLFIPYQWHGVPVGPAAGWLALAAYLALYPAIWVVLAGKIAGRRLRVAGSMGERTTWLKLMDTLMSLGWRCRGCWAVFPGTCWALRNTRSCP
jgi:apolipoprotein N-acyltransferase